MLLQPHMLQATLINNTQIYMKKRTYHIHIFGSTNLRHKLEVQIRGSQNQTN